MSFKVGSQVAWQLVDDEAVVIDLASGMTIGLNPAAAFLWSQLAGRSEDELAGLLAGEYEIEEAAARADVRAFLDDMRARKLIEDAS